MDHNKGDHQKPNVRCRYVACEVATHKDDSLFAATPPLEGLRLLLSQAAACEEKEYRSSMGKSRGRGRRKFLLIDVRKAHLHAVPVRGVYVQLPSGA